jgi:hypothetical protein
MNRIIKILLVSAVVGGVSYLCLEIYKLRNKIKVLTLQIQTLETFKGSHSNKSIDISTPEEIDVNITNNIQKSHSLESTVHSDTMIEQEILEYEQELQQVDQLIQSMQHPSSLEEVNNISETIPVLTEQETIDFSNIEQQITELNQQHTQEADAAQAATAATAAQEADAADATLAFAAAISLPEVEKDDTEPEETQASEPVKQIPTLIDNEALIQSYITQYNKNELKDLCGNHKISKKGTKNDLVQRLLKHNILAQLVNQKDTDSVEDTVDEEPPTLESNMKAHTLDTHTTVAVDEITQKLNDMEMMQQDIKQNLDPSSVLFKLQSYNNDQSSSKEEQRHLY